MSQVDTRENKMGVMPIRRLLISMSLPMILSMLVQALYNIVDSMYVSRIADTATIVGAGEKALAALSYAFPAQNLMIAVATGTGVGVNALLSKSLGEKNFHRANLTARNAVFLAAVSFAAFAVVGGAFSNLFFRMQSQDAVIVEFGTQYLTICTTLSFGIFGQVTFERLLQSTGKTFYTMITQGVGAIINIIFDPIFIFTMNMGVAGAALATVLGQIIAFLLAIFFNLRANEEISLNLRKFRPDKRIIGKIYAVGVPSIIMASIGSVMVFGMNKILTVFSSTAVAVFGVYFKLQSFVFMPVFGLNNGMVPIVAYNYGARQPDRITKTVKLSICFATGMMLIGFAAFQLFPGPLLEIFNASEDVLRIGEKALRTISFHFLVAGFCIISSSMFQALGHGMLSLWISVLRQLVVLLPAAFLLAKIGGLDAVWWAFPIAEIGSLICCSVFLRHVYHKEIVPLKA